MARKTRCKYKKRNAEFKAKAVAAALEDGVRPTARTMGVNESTLRHWLRAEVARLTGQDKADVERPTEALLKLAQSAPAHGLVIVGELKDIKQPATPSSKPSKRHPDTDTNRSVNTPKTTVREVRQFPASKTPATPTVTGSTLRQKSPGKKRRRDLRRPPQKRRQSRYSVPDDWNFDEPVSAIEPLSFRTLVEDVQSAEFRRSLLGTMGGMMAYDVLKTVVLKAGELFLHTVQIGSRRILFFDGQPQRAKSDLHDRIDTLMHPIARQLLDASEQLGSIMAINPDLPGYKHATASPLSLIGTRLASLLPEPKIKPQRRHRRARRPIKQLTDESQPRKKKHRRALPETSARPAHKR